MFRNSIALAAALSLAATPAIAQPSAAPLSLQHSVDRAGADGDGGSSLTNGGWFPPLMFATIVALGVLTATGVLFDDDGPDSP